MIIKGRDFMSRIIEILIKIMTFIVIIAAIVCLILRAVGIDESDQFADVESETAVISETTMTTADSAEDSS